MGKLFYTSHGFYVNQRLLGAFMTEFNYQKPFPIQKDTTNYRLLTKDYVSVSEFEGKKILKVDPKGLEFLAKEAMADVSFFLDLLTFKN